MESTGVMVTRAVLRQNVIVCHQSNKGKWNGWQQLRHKIELSDSYSNSEIINHYTATSEKTANYKQVFCITRRCWGTMKKGSSYRQSWSAMFWIWSLYHYFNVSYLLLFSELRFHLLVTRLVLSDTVSSYEIAADVSQLWILFARFLYQSKKII